MKLQAPTGRPHATSPAVLTSQVLGRPIRNLPIQQVVPSLVNLDAPRLSVVSLASKGFGSTKAKPAKPSSNPEVEVEACPCNSGRSYKRCCEPLHTNAKNAATPEAALRGRFSAFVKGQTDFVIKTTHAEYYAYHYNKAVGPEVQEQYAKDVTEGASKFVYADLKVTQVEPGSNDDEGFVAFSYKSARKPAEGQEEIPEDAWLMTQEKCRFLRVNGVWQFADYQNYDVNLKQLVASVEPTGEPTPAPAQSS